ncbi:MAG: hypothetical protein ACI4DV_07305 [Lachnospiraceae bacterium]
MKTFLELNEPMRLFVLFLFVLLLVGQVYAVASIMIRRNSSRMIAAGLPLIIVTFGFLAALGTAHRNLLMKGTLADNGIGRMSVPVLFGIAAVLFGITMAGYGLFRKKYLESMTFDAIQEGIENLPIGLCFYTLKGTPLLMNYKMGELCEQITGLMLTNAKRFRKRLSSEDVLETVEILHSGQRMMVRVPDGRVWTFRNKRITVRGQRILQMTATDVTEIYQLEEQLNMSNRELEMMNERLRRHSENVDQLTYEEETFAAKVNIHAEIGQALLASRYFLEQGEAFSENVLEIWRTNIALLRREVQKKQKTDPMKQLLDAAEAIGVKVHVNGKVPEENMNLLRMLLAAARECLTNAVRHAGADEMTIDIREKEEGYLAAFTNNGRTVEGPVTEGGGLSGLRKRIEQAGGGMLVKNDGKFLLTIFLPKEGVFQ